MKNKRIIAALLAGAMCVSLLTACSSNTDSGSSQADNGAAQTTESKTDDSKTEESKTDDSKSEESKSEEVSKPDPDPEGKHTFYVRDAGKSDKITATFFNTMSDATTDIEMTKTDEGDDHVTYSCQGDTTLYNMVHLTYGDNTVSSDVAFNSYVSGWYLKSGTLLPWAEGMELTYDPKYETKTFEFDGENKDVYIWTPADYDKDAADKYSTIYMFDGQSVLTTGRDRGMDNDVECWNVTESVAGMMSVTDNKAIVVCITDTDNRDDELVPDLGETIKTLDTKKRGTAFADFICDTIVPYVQENYNVYADAQHTSLAGSSLGGLETFCTVLTHPDTFGTGGVMSASFQVYDNTIWEKFLSDKVSMENAPFLYFYAGGYAIDNGNVNEPVYNMLIEKGYPKNKLVYDKYEPGRHLMVYWRNIYSEFLQAMFMQKVEALECGVPVAYVDNEDPLKNIPLEASIDPDDPRLDDKASYIYFDNSQTKWEKVYSYWWDAIPTNKLSGALYGAEWPGIEMERIEGTDIYRMIMPMGPTQIIFSSGVTDDEVAKGTIAYQTGDMPYNDQKNAGQIYRIDMSQEAVPGKNKEATKFKYPAGNWEDYEP